MAWDINKLEHTWIFDSMANHTKCVLIYVLQCKTLGKAYTIWNIDILTPYLLNGLSMIYNPKVAIRNNPAMCRSFISYRSSCILLSKHSPELIYRSFKTLTRYFTVTNLGKAKFCPSPPPFPCDKSIYQHV